MVCIYCSSETQVTNSRHQKRLNNVWRRRKCLSCGQVFTTTEAASLDRSLLFIDSNQKPHPFVQELLFLSLYNSLRHRNNALDEATHLCKSIIGRLLPLIVDGQLQRSDVIKTSCEVLKRFDGPAAVSYLAYHPLL